MEKKSLTVKEIFCGMPRLRTYFEQMDRTIKTYTPTKGSSEGLEALKKKRRALLKQAKEIDSVDLQILYYLNHLTRFTSLQFLTAVKKLFETQEELRDMLRSEAPPLE